MHYFAENMKQISSSADFLHVLNIKPNFLYFLRSLSLSNNVFDNVHIWIFALENKTKKEKYIFFVVVILPSMCECVYII